MTIFTEVVHFYFIGWAVSNRGVRMIDNTAQNDQNKINNHCSFRMFIGLIRNEIFFTSIATKCQFSNRNIMSSMV